MAAASATNIGDRAHEFAENNYGVAVNPQTVFDLTKSFHGIAIQIGANIIGRIQSWNPTFAAREGSHIYELNRETWGRPIDIVMARETGRSISCDRVEVWNGEIERSFGTNADPSFLSAVVGAGRNGNDATEWRDLCEQTHPFACSEVWNRGILHYRAWDYRGCWFTSKSLGELSSEGDAIVRASVEMMYVIRHGDNGTMTNPNKVETPSGERYTGIGIRTVTSEPPVE